MLAVSRTALPVDDDAYAYEFKWDGIRAVSYVDAGDVRLLSRTDRDISAGYPELAPLADALPHRVVLDGEIVALDATGRPSFEALQSRMHVTNPGQVRRLMADIPATYLVFDVLYLDGHDVVDAPYTERRRLLEELGVQGPSWQTTPAFVGGGADVLATSKANKLEGVVAKKLDARYYPGRRCDVWLKLKNLRTQEVVIGGWQPGEGRRANAIGSLLLGVPGDDGLHYAGHVGTGFTDAMLRDLSDMLVRIEQPDPPFVTEVPRAHAKGVHWVQPEVVGEVVFSEWTREGRLRQPAWRGLRPDKRPTEVVRES